MFTRTRSVGKGVQGVKGASLYCQGKERSENLSAKRHLHKDESYLLFSDIQIFLHVRNIESIYKTLFSKVKAENIIVCCIDRLLLSHCFEFRGYARRLFCMYKNPCYMLLSEKKTLPSIVKFCIIACHQLWVQRQNV